MARIPEAELNRLKREVDLVALVQSSGVKLERRGQEWVGLCRWHDDREPSLIVSPSKSPPLWNCLGACQVGGTAIDFVMREENLPFREAVTWIADRFLPDVEISDGPPAAKKLPEEEIEQLLAASDHELREWVVSFYREALRSHTKARKYLASRGLDDPELFDRFELGFADRELGLRLPSKKVKAGAELRERLTDLGFIKASGHERMTGRIVVPIRDLSGRLTQLYGRTITPNLRKGTPHHLYLPGPLDGVFHAEAVTGSSELILCEAILDALTFVRHGFSNVTTAFGAKGVSPSLLEAMKAHGTRRVLIAFDRDDAGEKAARELGKRLLAEGIDAYRVLFPRNLDANDYACKVQPAAKSLDLVLRQAQWMGNGKAPRWTEAPVGLYDAPSARAAKKEEAAPEASSSFVAPPATEEDTRAEVVEPAPTLLPAPPPSPIPTEIREHEVLMTLGDRLYRIRGLAKNLSYDVLKVNLRVTRKEGEGLHVDKLDFYAARQRAAFVKQAAIELGVEEEVVKRDLGRVLLRLEELQDEQIRRALEPKAQHVTLSPEEEREALELLEDPVLEHRILGDLEACGVVGEETNKLVLYLASVSRLLRKPLAVMVQSSSAAGKSALMESVLAMIPEEHRVAYSAMTGQSLFYMGETNLKHRVLAIAEEEGAEQASYALKLLQSEGKLSIASTGKDPATGRLLTHEYHVEGPAAILTTTTSIDLDEELLNRCLVLSVDESREQTRAIHRFQREGETLEGLLRRRDRERIRKVHQNAQRLLRPLGVVNRYASQLTFPETCTRTRRDHEKYLALIRTIALVRQYQREVKVGLDGAGQEVEYVEVELEDIRLANQLAHEVLGRTLDELPPQTRKLLCQIYEHVSESCERLAMKQSEVRFYRRELRETLGWGDTQLKVHLARLVDLEYLVVHRLGHAQRHAYELIFDGGGRRGETFLPGLIDVEALLYDGNRSASSPNRSGPVANRSAPGRPPVGGQSGGGRVEQEPEKAGGSSESRPKSPESTSRDLAERPPSYPSQRPNAQLSLI